MPESIPSIVDHNVVHVETPMGVSEIVPDMTAIRYMAHDRAEERGIRLPNETIDQLELLQTPVALCHHIRPAEDSNLPAPLRTALTGFSFVHKFAPPTIRNYCLTALPLADPSIFLNTQAIATNAVHQTNKYVAAPEDLTLSAMHQYMNFHLEGAIDNWITLANPAFESRVAALANLLRTESVNLTPLLVTKLVTGLFPLTLIQQNMHDPEALLKSVVLFGSIAGVTQTARKIHDRMQMYKGGVPKYMRQPMFDVSF